MMFGFATNEMCTEYMPAPIAFAHKILQYMSTLRHKGQLNTDFIRFQKSSNS